ncbi:MAG: DUF222 domain-containing protein [Candidatus Dormibacteria bacterium]
MGLGEGGGLLGGLPQLDVGGEVAAIRTAALTFAHREDRDFSPAEIGEQIVHLGTSIDILRREQARLVGVFASTKEWDRQGSNSAIDWVRHQARLSTSDALELAAVGGHIAALPAASAALDDGRIGFGHMVQLARNAAFAARSCSGAFDELPLLPHAEEESVGRFMHTCGHARHAQDPKGHADAEVNAVESRELTFNEQQDGTTWINVRLDNQEAAITRSVLEPLARRLGPDDTRTLARRQADALLTLVHQSVNEGPTGEPDGRRVTINVTCRLETLMNLPGSAAAEIEHGAPISAVAVGRLACNASITKILLDGRMIPVAVGHSKRVLTKAERRALNARDRHCRYPGCERPPSQCEGHHVEWYSRSRVTSLDNMILLCFHHHWRVHEGGWVLSRAEDGQILVTPPQLLNLARGPGSSAAA